MFYLYLAVTVVASSLVGAGIVYALWKLDVCCKPGRYPKGSIVVCPHKKVFKLTGLRWARPTWLRVRRKAALRTMTQQIEAEANRILVTSGG